MIETPQFAYPFRIDTAGDVVVVEQDSVDDIAACVAALLQYTEGDRPESMRFGRPVDLEFSLGDLDLPAIAAKLEEFEPRAIYLLEQQRDEFEQALTHVRLLIGDR